jgi:hypothetical protein
MSPNKILIMPLVFTCVCLLDGCGRFGKVSQGKTIDYDSEKGLVTLIQDSNYMEPGNPRYDVLPPVTVKVPLDSKQMGPAPEAGKLMRLDSSNKTVVFFNADSQTLSAIQYTLIEQVTKVFENDSRVAGISFPVVNRQKKTIAVYSPRRRELVVFSVPDEYFSLPDDTWKEGDEIRYYYKDPHQALRLMNITKSEIS